MVNSMKKKILVLTAMLVVLALLAVGITSIAGRKNGADEDKVTIVTSFYPMYVLALNLTEDIDDVEVINLTDNNIGCLHDYQLTTEDMRVLTDGDILLINGGEMELFLDNVVSNYPDLTVIDSSENISFLAAAAHIHDHSSTEEQAEETHSEDEHAKDEHADEAHSDDEHEEEEHAEEAHSDDEHEDEEHVEEAHSEDEHTEEEHNHVHGTVNGHVWLDMNRYVEQINHTAELLAEADQEHAEKYFANAENYAAKITQLRDDFEETLSEMKGQEVITFHGAFAYLADELGLEIVYSVDMDSDTALSAGDIANIIDEIRYHNIKYLFAEELYSREIAEQIANETGATVCLLETNVSGNGDKDSYINGIEKNLELLKSLFTEN